MSLASLILTVNVPSITRSYLGHLYSACMEWSSQYSFRLLVNVSGLSPPTSTSWKQRSELPVSPSNCLADSLTEGFRGEPSAYIAKRAKIHFVEPWGWLRVRHSVPVHIVLEKYLQDICLSRDILKCYVFDRHDVTVQRCDRSIEEQFAYRFAILRASCTTGWSISCVPIR